MDSRIFIVKGGFINEGENASKFIIFNSTWLPVCVCVCVYEERRV